MPNCRSCNAEVIFVPSARTGSLMILDAQPATDGNVVINEAGQAEVLKKDLFAEPGIGPRFKDHHATCKFAKDYRKPRRKP